MWDIMAEIGLVGMACVLLLLATGKKTHEKTYEILTMLGLGAALLLWLQQGGETQVTWHGHLQQNTMTFGFGATTLFSVLLLVFFARRSIRSGQKRLGEYYALMLLSTVGMLGLIKANSLLSVFLGLELMSLPLYALVAMGRYAQVEAALKYFVLGALATGLLLYGFSLLYGVSGSFMYQDITRVLAGTLSADQQSLLALACVFLVTGLAFKLGLAPFHSWVPDVYEGATTPVALFIATAPKIASTAMIMRLFIDVMPMTLPHWHTLWLTLAIASIVLGNLSALMQTKWLRLIAYSSISHMGFLVLGLLVAPDMGQPAMQIYMVIYAMTTLLTLGVTLWLEDQGEPCADIAKLSGLNRLYPLASFALLLGLLSLAGIPPLAGFMAKLSIIMALVHEGFVGIAITALLGSVVALYYYIRIIKQMYFDAPEKGVKWQVSPSCSGAMLLIVPASLMLILGLFPTSIVHYLF